MSAREELVKIYSADDTAVGSQNLLSLLEEFSHRSGSLHPKIAEGLAELSSAQINQLWFALGEIFNNELANHLAGDSDSERLLVSVVLMAHVCVGLIKLPDEEHPNLEISVSESLVKFIVVLGGVVEVIEGALSSHITNICEDWLSKKLPQSETFQNALFSVLLKNSLLQNAKKGDVKRVYQQRLSLPEYIKDNEDKTKVCSVCACLVSPLYLSSDDGTKFLSLIINSDECVKPAHHAVRQFLPKCSKSQACKLAQVYCRAWRNASPNNRKLLEDSCLQDLMFSVMVVHPTNSAHLSGNLHAFLHTIHSHQKITAFSSMLQRLYNPFLWRHLNCTNGFVRTNATRVLCDAYPLEDSSLLEEDKENHMIRVHSTLSTALMDPVPSVRIAAIQGVCRVLHIYWVNIPKHNIQEWCALLFKKLALDASSTQVRLQVVKGISRLLDCNDALPFLQKCLPQLSGSFDDVNSSVRVAMAKLLLKLQRLKIIKFWEVVSVEHLLHRLSVDSSSVTQVVSKILSPAFFPIQKDDNILVERCIALISQDRAASRVFFEHVSIGLDIGSVVRVMLLLYKSLRTYLLHKSAERSANGSLNMSKSWSKRDNNSPQQDKENSADNLQNSSGEEGDFETPFDDPDVVGGILDALVIFWTTNTRKLNLQVNSKWLSILQNKMSRGLPLMSACFEDSTDLSRALLYLASYLPKTMVPTLVSHCVKRLRALEADEVSGTYEEADYLIYVNALCNWNKTAELLDIIEECVDSTLNAALKIESDRQNNRRGSIARNAKGDGVRKVRFNAEEDKKLDPDVCLAILRGITEHKLNKMNLMSNSREKLTNLCCKMEKVLEVISLRLKNGSAVDGVSDSFLSGCLSEHLCLAVMLHNTKEEGPDRGNVAGRDTGARCTRLRDQSAADATVEVPQFDGRSKMLQCMEWATHVLVPSLQSSSLDSSSFTNGSTLSVLNINESSAKRKRTPEADKDLLSSSAFVRNCTVSLLKMLNCGVVTAVASEEFVRLVTHLVDQVLVTDSCSDILRVCVYISANTLHFTSTYESSNGADALATNGGDALAASNCGNALAAHKMCFRALLNSNTNLNGLDKAVSAALSRLSSDRIHSLLSYCLRESISLLSRHSGRTVTDYPGMGWFFTSVVGKKQTSARVMSAVIVTDVTQLRSPEQHLAVTKLVEHLQQQQGTKFNFESIREALENMQSTDQIPGTTGVVEIMREIEV